MQIAPRTRGFTATYENIVPTLVAPRAEQLVIAPAISNVVTVFPK